ncbi:MAG TPA: hypothetical protein GX523_20115 [Desulfitobacterium dehalogenans]|uniref:Uncharacterized protein n=1 Tax=Desulfitobacterium dehalogenans TaxID=36854 RepID=A0A7C7D8N1_9FIRM|nr:hypothetical protein [Desulfitobacterium dehalogenans]
MFQKFECEECAKTFDSYTEAFIHELKCFSLKRKQEVELDKAKKEIFDGTYNCFVKRITSDAKEFIPIQGEYSGRFVHFVFTLELTNGEQVIISDRGIDSGKLVSSQEILAKVYYELDILVSKKFEGTLTDEHGYTYLLDGINIFNILSRMKGKKVRIEIIE